jgi:hypothetical protein
MTFATVAQGDYYVRYQATQDAIRRLKADLALGYVAGTVGSDEYENKRTCLVDLFRQSEALWKAMGPAVVWS